MKIAVLAAKGRAGSAIVQEAINAGFEVSAFVRSKAHFDERVHLVVKDMFSLTSTDLQGFDVIIDAFGEWQDLSLHLKHIEYLNSILQGNEAKLIVVGGAGSLYMNTTHTLRLMDTPEFPKEYMGVAEATAEVLEFVRKSNLNWLYISPAALFYEGKSQNYELIGEEFKVNAKGESRVSYSTYATALIKLLSSGEIKMRQRISLIEL
ncbi:SDR family oxidoreductase [Helicobacter sp. UBA3407]|uniref:SDR family oxidoreductase n=1 Tax=Helicobacter sp. UBA3407 TaxID=1946588 RepID=UPI00260E6DCA|nr:SDR family oxidoreductase [Helicobacter sp. UBA3407]